MEETKKIKSDFRYDTGEAKVPWAAIGENVNLTDIESIIKFLVPSGQDDSAYETQFSKVMEQITELVKKEVTAMMGLKEFNPDLVKIFRYPHAIPQYSFESKNKLEAISAIEKEFPGLLLAGNIRDGIGMADRIKQGRNIADKLAKE